MPYTPSLIQTILSVPESHRFVQPEGRLQTILPVGNHTPPRRQIFVYSLLKVYTWSIENASKIFDENLRIICCFYKKDFTKSKMCSIISGKERGCMCEPGK